MFTADKKNPEVWILLEKEQLRDLVIQTPIKQVFCLLGMLLSQSM